MDRFRWQLLVVLGLSLVVVAGVATPVLASTTFNHNENFDNYWHIQQNWSDGVPDATKDAIIPSGQTCVIHNSQGHAYAKTINLGGTLIVDKRNLTLGDQDYPYSATTSTIDGLLLIDAGDDEGVYARLKISGEHTIVGTNGIIQMAYETPEPEDDPVRAIIVQDTSNDDLLILDHTCAGDVSRDCGLSLTGTGEVRVQLDNRSFVVADFDHWDYRLHLTNRPKTSTAKGYWICENGGTMAIETTVTGCGDWRSVDVNCTDACTVRRGIGCGGTFIIPWQSDGCVSGTGDVTLQAGCGLYDDHQLKVQDNQFSTSGRLLWQSLEGQGGEASFISNPAILVFPDAIARFNCSGTGCESCP